MYKSLELLVGFSFLFLQHLSLPLSVLSIFCQCFLWDNMDYAHYLPRICCCSCYDSWICAFYCMFLANFTTNLSFVMMLLHNFLLSLHVQAEYHLPCEILALLYSWLNNILQCCVPMDLQLHCSTCTSTLVWSFYRHSCWQNIICCIGLDNFILHIYFACHFQPFCSSFLHAAISRFLVVSA